MWTEQWRGQVGDWPGYKDGERAEAKDLVDHYKDGSEVPVEDLEQRSDIICHFALC